MNEIIMYGGTVLTMDEQRPSASALAIRGDRIRAVGSDAVVLALRTDRTRLIPLEGKTVCPGFIDAHHHLAHAAWCELGVDVQGCTSVRALQRRLTASLAHARTGSWLYAYNYTPQHFRDRRPTRHDLDQVCGDRPTLVLHFSLHEAVASSAALQAAGIDRATPDPPGGRIVRDRHGAPTGELIETAAGPVEALARHSAAGTSYADWLAALGRYCSGLFAAGITHVCDPGVDGVLEQYLRRAAREERLPIPVTMLFVSSAGLFQPPEDRLVGPVTGATVDGLPVGALKLFADGGSRCASCASLREGLAAVTALAGRAVRLRRPGLLISPATPDRPRLSRDGRLHTGYLHYRPGQLQALCARAQGCGFGLAIHAACNAGIGVVTDALGRLPTPRYRHRVEHLVSLDRDQATRLATIGIIGVVQPAYVPLLGDEWEAMPVPPRLHSVPLRDLLDAGITLAGSSDAPMAPYAPLHGMAAAMNRRTAAGLVLQREQAITPREALRMWTAGGAAAAYKEGEIGIVRAGARADLILLSDNPLGTPPAQMARIRVLHTMIGGITVFEEV
jgi:predicted amidohydrolase YtcJ